MKIEADQDVTVLRGHLGKDTLHNLYLFGPNCLLFGIQSRIGFNPISTAFPAARSTPLLEESCDVVSNHRMDVSRELIRGERRSHPDLLDEIC